MMIKPILKTILAIACALGLQQAHATIIFSQGFTGTSPQSVSGTGLASQSELNITGSTAPTASDTSIETADFFTVSSNTSLGTIRWAGEYNGGAALADNFRLRIYEDDGTGSPELTTTFLDLNIGSPTRSTLAGQFFGNNLFSYEHTLMTPVALTTGTNYWLSIANNLSGANTWRWTSTENDPGGAFFRQGMDIDTVAWGNRVGTYQFQLEDVAPVPLPAAFWLFASGLAFLATRRKKI